MLWNGTAIWLTSTSLIGGPLPGQGSLLVFPFLELVDGIFCRNGRDFCTRRPTLGRGAPLGAAFLNKSWGRTSNALGLLGVSILGHQCALGGELQALQHVAVVLWRREERRPSPLTRSMRERDGRK